MPMRGSANRSKIDSCITDKSTHKTAHILVIESLSTGRKYEKPSPEIALNRPLTSIPNTNPRRTKAEEVTPTHTGKKEGSPELVLHGDIAPLTHIFRGFKRSPVSTSVPESIYIKLQKYPGGISKYYDDAVAGFDGNLPALVNAAAKFVDERRLRAPQDPPRNATGRVLPKTFDTIRKIEAALADIQGMSRAKVLAGVVQLKLQTSR